MASGREILLKARTHFRATRTVETLRKITVPEWETDIHFWPEMSVEESRAVGQHVHLRGGEMVINVGDVTDAAVTQVIFRARDAFGTRLFSEEDDAALRDTHPSVLQRIASEMGWTSSTTAEGAEKN